MQNPIVIELLNILKEYSNKIKEDLTQLNGYKLTTIQECLSPEIFNEFTTVELSQQTQQHMQTAIIELKSFLQQFISVNPIENEEQSSQIHTQILLILQKIVALINDDIARVDDELNQLKDVSIEQKIVDLTMMELENM